MELSSCTSTAEELNQELPETNPAGGQRLELGISGFQVQRPNHSATKP